MKKSFLFFALLMSWTIVFAQSSALETFVSTPSLRNAAISLEIKNLTTGELVIAHNANMMLAPASTQKLLTTATALDMLGADFRFSTYLEMDGVLQNGTLRGNLYIRGTGDPTLGSEKVGDKQFLQKWVRAIQTAGIQRIEGCVIADMCFFDGDATNTQWLWEDVGNYYAPGIFAINYLDNTTNIQLRSASIGSVANVVKVLPEIPDLTFENHIRCTETTYDGAYVHGMPYNNCRYLTGSIPSNQGVFGVKGDIPNPGLLLAQHFTARLRAAGVTVRDEANYITEGVPTPRKLLYEHQSEPLTEIVKEINHNSNNMYAESVFRYLGSRIDKPCTIENSKKIIINCMKNRGIILNTRFIQDGCGLAPTDAVSADIFVQLLQYMKKSEKETFITSLPISGQSGTLSNFLKGTALDGKVHAKSGTTSQSKSYAGYVFIGEQVYAFAVIVNNAEVRPRQVQREIEKFLLNTFSSL